MKVISIMIFKQLANGQNAVLLSSAFDLSSFGFFQRGTVKELITFGSRQIATASEVGVRQAVKLKDESHICYCLVNSQKLAVCVATDAEYPSRVAFSLIGRATQEFMKLHQSAFTTATTNQTLDVPELTNLLTLYQDPAKADPISRVEKELDETQKLLVKTIDQLVERNESLQQLADKSEDLSFQTKIFMKKSEEMNSCC